MKFAILGIHPELSKTELETVINQKTTEAGSECVTFDSNKSLIDLQKQLGGSSKLGEIIKTINNVEKIENILINYLSNQPTDRKLRFGISVYDLGGLSFSKNLRRANKKLGLFIKKRLKADGRSVRLVTSKEKTLSSVVVAKNKLTTDGVDFCLLVSANKIIIGVTKTYQNFEDWSHRDYDRPARNAKQGMLPPKLARMMINLSGVKSDATLLDPFCGSGTVLMEAAMLGFNKVIGSDISQQATEDSITNLDWLKNQGVEMTMPTITKTSAVNLKLESKVDVVITEPFLGDPRNGKEPESEIKKNISKLETLYKESFGNILQLMNPEAVLVIIVPVHIFRNQEFTLAIKSIFSNFKLTLKNKPLRYQRKDQFIARDIWIFTKN